MFPSQRILKAQKPPRAGLKLSPHTQVGAIYAEKESGRGVAPETGKEVLDSNPFGKGTEDSQSVWYVSNHPHRRLCEAAGS